MTGQQQPRHPAWCDPSRCTVDTDPVSGQHRCAVEQAPPTVGLRAHAHLARAERTWAPRTFVHVEIDTALPGLAQFALLLTR